MTGINKKLFANLNLLKKEVKKSEKEVSKIQAVDDSIADLNKLMMARNAELLSMKF